MADRFYRALASSQIRGPKKKVIRCPECHGTGVTPLLVMMMGHPEPVAATCTRCQGEGNLGFNRDEWQKLWLEEIGPKPRIIGDSSKILEK